jgi:hypothetical protein
LSLLPLTIGLMNSHSGGVVIDAALRFARSNPELLRYAQENARQAGVSVDDLLRDAIDRVVAIRHTESESSSELPQTGPRLLLTSA